MKRLLTLAISLLAAATGAQAQPTYVPDPSHTFAFFEIDHIGLSTIRARFDKREGVVQLDRAAQTGRVDFTIETASLNSGIQAFDRFLAGKDLLNSAEFPTARFVGDKLAFSGDKLTEVAGNLTLLGKTQPVTFKALRFNCVPHPLVKREVCGGDFEATIQRSQFGLTWGVGRGFPDTVRLVVQVEAIKQE